MKISDTGASVVVKDADWVKHLVAGEGENCLIDDDDGELGIWHGSASVVHDGDFDCRFGAGREARRPGNSLHL